MSKNEDIFKKVDIIHLDASLRIIAAQFLSDFKEGELTLDEAVELVMQFRQPAFRDADPQITPN